MKFKPKNLLVTGGAGFIGSHFIIYYLNQHPQTTIINLDKLTYAGSLSNVAEVAEHPHYRFVQGDIVDGNLISQLLHEFQVDCIVHFAAESHVDRSITDPDAFITTNVVGTHRLLEAARQYWLQSLKLSAESCRFHHISTDEVYGTLKQNDPAFTETTPYAPNSPYSASKASSDHLVRSYHHTYGLPVTISNCSNNFGSKQHTEKLIPTVIRACLMQKPIPVYGDGSNIRDWLHVTDHCSAIESILLKANVGETYNIGGDNEINNLDLVKQICQLFDEIRPRKTPHEQLIQFVTDRPGHDWRYAIDCSKIKDQLGWRAKPSFQENLRQTIQWYLSIFEG